MTKPKQLEPEYLQIESLQPVIAELERAAVWARGRMGDRDKELPAVTVVIQTKGKKAGCCGWFDSNRWATKEGSPVHELTITAEHLFDDPIEVIHTVVHESSHLYNKDILPPEEKDCSDSGRHNKKFKETAEAMGLVVESDGTKGWAATSLSDELRRDIEEDFKPDLAVFRIFREVPLPKESKPVKKVVPWLCECPVTVQVAANITLVATCDECNESFVLKNKPEEA